MSLILTAPESPALVAARAARSEAAAALRSAADEFEQATPENAEAREGAFTAAELRLEQADAEVQRLERIARARAAAPDPDRGGEQREAGGGGSIRVGREPLTYQRHDVRSSYFLDFLRSQTGRGLDEQVRARLQRHADEMRVEAARRDAAIEAGFGAGLDALLGELADTNPALAEAVRSQMVVRSERRDLTRVDGAGGEFVPPLWVIDDYAGLARAGRPFANRVPTIALPAGTDSINIPRITTGSLTGVQTADNAAVTEQDIVTATVTAPVRTIAGQQDVALQLLEQSPIAFDQMIYGDLMADYALQLDTQLLNGSGASGQVLGILNVVGVNAVTYTDGTPTVPELWPKVADAINQAATNRKMPPSAVWTHARRWFWMASQLDSSSRPFFIAQSAGPYQALGGAYGDLEVQDGPVTNLLGVPQYLDLNMPTNLGAGTNEDRAVVTRMSDHRLFEGAMRTRMHEQTLSGNLTVRLQVYAYVAFTAGRFPAGTSVVSGTGLVTPTF